MVGLTAGAWTPGGAGPRQPRTGSRRSVTRCRRRSSRERRRPFPAAEGGRAQHDEHEIPVSIAAALPSLAVMDITNDVSREVAPPRSPTASRTSTRRARNDRAGAGAGDGLLRGSRGAARARRPVEPEPREKLLAFLLGPRSEQVPSPTARCASASGSGSSSSRSTRNTVPSGRSRCSASALPRAFSRPPQSDSVRMNRTQSTQ